MTKITRTPLTLPAARKPAFALREFFGLTALALKDLGARKIMVDTYAWQALDSLSLDKVRSCLSIARFLKSGLFNRLGLEAVWADRSKTKLHIIKARPTIRGSEAKGRGFALPKDSGEVQVRRASSLNTD